MTRRDLLTLASLVLPVVALVVSGTQLVRTAQRSSDQADEALQHWQQCIDERRNLRDDLARTTDKIRQMAKQGQVGFVVDDVITAFPEGYVCGQHATPQGSTHWVCRPGP